MDELLLVHGRRGCRRGAGEASIRGRPALKVPRGRGLQQAPVQHPELRRAFRDDGRAPPLRAVDDAFQCLGQHALDGHLGERDGPVAGFGLQLHLQARLFAAAGTTEDVRDLVVAVRECDTERRVLEAVLGAEVRMPLDEPAHELDVAMGASHMQRGAPVVVPGIQVGAALLQVPHDVERASGGGATEGRGGVQGRRSLAGHRGVD
mmetsp:Transcript_119452/g.343131  ORF Transcript_119452/g.343131 Transcript_119452/m.343131 type:complete len:206 (-) Transcript_119452:452-1069(-)